MAKVLALLRGINVGGRTVKMDVLRAAFEGMGFSGVRTYIQSGNVLFDAEGREPGAAMREEIEETLRRTFGFEIAAVLLSCGELALLLAGNPYARKPEENERVHVTVFREPPSPAALAALAPEPGSGDEFQASGRFAYILCRGGYAHTPYSNAFFEKRLKIPATTRNIETMEAIAAMCEKQE